MQIVNLTKKFLAPVLSLALSTPVVAGNDSVAMVYLNSAQQTQAYKIETSIYKGSYGITVIVSSRAAFSNIASNYSEIYISSTQYQGWVKGLHLVGNVIHGRTPTGYQVAITTY